MKASRGRKESHWSDHSRSHSPSTPDFLLAERDLYVQDICRWEIASTPLLCNLFTPTLARNEIEIGCGTSDDFLLACLLRIQAAMNIVLLTRAFNPDEMEYDKFQDQFRTIVELSEKISPILANSRAVRGDEQEAASTFRFDIGILPALMQTALLCRERAIRSRAIRVLQNSKGYKEGIWDAASLGAIATWVSKLEDESANEDWVPDEKRVVLVSSHCRIEQRWSQIRVRTSSGEERDGVVRW